MIDESDRKILAAIQKSPDLTMRELGEATGLSHTPCWRRLQKLREDGVIQEKRYVLSPQAMGFELILICFIRMKEHTRDKLSEFEVAIARMPEVMQCYSITGDHDYVARVLAKDVKDYELTVKNRLIELPHVAFISTSLTLKEIKSTTDVPI